MWPFRRKKKDTNRLMKKVVVGLVIGGAIGSIVGKKMMERAEKDKGIEGEENED